MAPKVTSSSNRSKRNSNKPVTTSKGRQNRANVSQAKVTNSGGRGSGSGRVTNASQRTNTGSARVTSSTRPSLPPGRRGGELTTRRQAAEGRAAQAARGSASTTTRTANGSSNRPALPPARSTTERPGTTRRAPTRMEQAQDKLRRAQQGSRSSTVRVAGGSGPDRMTPEGMFKGPRLSAGTLKALSLPGIVAGGVGAAKAASDPKYWEGKSRELRARMNKGSDEGRTVNKGKNVVRGVEGTGRYTSGDMQTRFKSDRPATQNRPSNNTPSTQTRSGSTTRRSGGGGGASRSMPSAVTRSMPSSNAGMKNQDKNYRGNLFEKTFGYKPGEAPDQVRARQDKAANPSNFDTKSETYKPETKADGSQYADKKPDMKNVKEYDRRKRRYYD